MQSSIQYRVFSIQGSFRRSRATAKSDASVFFGLMNWTPIGNSFPSRNTVPNGTEIAGMPVRFAGAAKISSRYMDTGSLFSPILKAALGVVGVAIYETVENARVRSSRSALRKAVALR